MHIRLVFAFIFILQLYFGLPAHALDVPAEKIGATIQAEKSQPKIKYEQEIIPLERSGLKLYLQRLIVAGANPQKQILLVHGLTYSSHEFDVNVEDYSLARYLARNGYAVWTLDIAGYGRSQAVEDGFLPDSNYAAEDIATAASKILALSGQKKLDVLGWSWGTVTAGLFASRYPDMVNKLVLYAPIITGLGQSEVKNPYNHNTWEHAAGDFQTGPDGSIDYGIVIPDVVNAFQSNCWKYDKDSSPNGGRKDLLVANDAILIPFDQIKSPTLAIGGDKDPYLNLPALEKEMAKLPAGSKFELIPGAAHAMMMEKPYYQRFREQIINFLD